MTTKAGIERRSAVRAKRVLSIQYRLLKCRKKIFDKSWHLSTTEDMSFNGLAFYSSFEFKKNDILEIHVVMSGLLDIYKGQATVARVVNQNKKNYFLIGVKIPLSSQDKKTTKKTVSKKIMKKNAPKKKNTSKQVKTKKIS